MNIELRRARNRQTFIFLLVSLGMLVMLSRLYYWQALQSNSGHNLAKLANQEHIENQVLDAPRGLIYDAQNRILATNVVRDDVYIEPIQFESDHPDKDLAQSDLLNLIQSLNKVLPNVSLSQLKTDFALSSQTVRIAVKIDPSQSQQLRTLHLPYTFLEPRTWRVYPSGDLASQVLGYVTQDENQNHGVYGIEGKYNSQLAGKPGSFIAETDLSGNPLVVGSSSQQAAVNGANIQLTLDSTIQYVVEQGLAETVKQMEAQSGTVVVLNARTGAIVAMAGAPSFDPNQYGQYASDTGCLGTEQVYFNPALFCAYEPGSTLKAVTMAAALDQGLITPDTAIEDPGYLSFDDAATVNNWANLGYGHETMTQVLEHSANVGAAYVAHNVLGAKRYYPYLASFGFGSAMNLDGAEEAGGYRTPGTPNWSPTDLTRQAFGQGILASPLQVARAYQAIANDGVMMRPYLVSSITNNGQTVVTHPTVDHRVISAKAAHLLTGMLVQAATEGSAHAAKVLGYSFAAKTGTATTQGISASQTEASIAGYLPASNPQFVILVKIDRPQASIYGGTAAAPLWKSIAQQLMWYYHVPPDEN